MQITLTSKEFDEAVSLWLSSQGFNTHDYSIDSRVIAGRTDSGAGTRVEVTLEPRITAVTSVPAEAPRLPFMEA